MHHVELKQMSNYGHSTIFSMKKGVTDITEEIKNPRIKTDLEFELNMSVCTYKVFYFNRYIFLALSSEKI